MTPLELTILIECCVCGKPGSNFSIEQWESDPSKDARDWFKGNGVIDENNIATPKGQAWLDFIRKTPCPVEQWVLPKECDNASEE